MKVPCTECNQLCRRKVVNRGVENLNRIYYKCEICKHKVGWEDELMAGVKPWTKAKAALPPQPPAALPQEQPAAVSSQQPTALPDPQPTVVQQQQPAPATARGDDQEVQIVYERPAPELPTRAAATRVDGDAAVKAPAAAAAPPPAPGTVPPQRPDPIRPSQTGDDMQAPPGATQTRAQRRQATAATQREPQPQAAAPPQASGLPTRAGAAQAHPQAAHEASPAATATKRKHDEALGDSGGRPVKRPARQAPAADATTGAGAPAARAAVADAGASRANGVYANGASAAVPAAGTAVAATGGGAASGVFAAADGVFSSREARTAPPARAPATGVQAAALPSVRPPPAARATAAVAAPVAGSGSFSPRLTPEQEEMRRQNRDIAYLKQCLREENKRTQEAAAAAEQLRLRVDPLERELRELRHKYQESLQRERQLVEQLNVYKARERAAAQAAAQHAAAQAAAQHAAAQAAAQQRAQAGAQAAAAAAAAAAQEAARQRVHAQAQAQAQAQAEFAKQYGYWGYQQHFNGRPQQQEYEGAWYGTANGHHAGHPGRGAGPGQGSGGGAGPDGTYGNGGGPAAGGCGGGGGGGAAPPPPQAAAAAAQQQPADDPALVAFATATPPVLDDTTPVRALKQFIVEAGAEGLVRGCSEKAELLTLARERLNAWEVRRAVACSRLVSQAVGDRALFRIDPGGVQKTAIVKAYRELTLRVHPDKNPGDDLATQAFQYLNDAYKRLTENRN